MGRKRKQLSHAETWDDSALVQSWNDALAEYTLYHSIHARGERVEDVIKDVEAGAQDAALNGDTGDNGRAPGRSNDAMSEELEDGELEEPPEIPPIYTNSGSANKNDDSPSSHAHTLPADYASQQQENRGLPHVVAVSGKVFFQDEALKNLMMSWYYAGYYTGLYEGQQKAQKNDAI